MTRLLASAASPPAKPPAAPAVTTASSSPPDGTERAQTNPIMQLVSQAQDGDSNAFGHLYDHYCDTVYRYIYYRVGSRATAEDLTSETFLRALRRIGTFTWQGRDLGAWLVTIARNLVADHFTSSRFRLEVTIGEMLDTGAYERSPEEIVLLSFEHQVLRQALLELPERMRQIVWLWASGLGSAAIGQQLGISPSTVRVHLHHARHRLADKLALHEAVGVHGPNPPP